MTNEVGKEVCLLAGIYLLVRGSLARCCPAGEISVSVFSCSAGEISVDEVCKPDCDSDVDSGSFLEAAIDRRSKPAQ